jgi:3-methyladenine DNA glycosylase AlkD
MVKQKSKYIKQVEDCLTRHAQGIDPLCVEGLRAYMGTNHRMLGLGTLLQRQLAKQKFGLNLENQELLSLCDALFKTSSLYEAKNAALNVLDVHYKLWSKDELISVLPSWVDHVDNWGHSDYLSKFYTRFLEEKKFRELFLPILKEWNVHGNPWKRRQSMVALMYYARTRQNHLPFKAIISFVKPHLEAPEYFVQKGLGWTLRECYNVYPDLTYAFIDAAYDKISSTAFTAACEKMPLSQRGRLKRKRKLHRTKRK